MLIIESGHGLERGREGESQRGWRLVYSYSFAARLYGFQAEGSTRQLQGNRGELEFQSSWVPGGDAKSQTPSHMTPSHRTPSHMMRLSQARP